LYWETAAVTLSLSEELFWKVPYVVKKRLDPFYGVVFVTTQGERIMRPEFGGALKPQKIYRQMIA
jgi:hypothetical protein